jgi:hypothetical protein
MLGRFRPGLFLLTAGMMKLRARMAAFVSLLARELPALLTIFRLYSEMLVDGMVTDEGRSRSTCERNKDSPRF